MVHLDSREYRSSLTKAIQVKHVVTVGVSIMFKALRRTNAPSAMSYLTGIAMGLGTSLSKIQSYAVIEPITEVIVYIPSVFTIIYHYEVSGEINRI